MKKLNILLLLFALPFLGIAQTARLQVIHNCAATGAAVVDVLVNGAFPAASFDNLAFRTATPFLTVPAGVNLEVTINAPTSTDSSNALFRQTVNLTANGTFIVVASGTIGAGTYTPARPFSLQVFGTGRETSVGGATSTDILVLHGSTDAPVVDVAAVGVGNVIDSLAYGQFAGYLSLPVANYNLQVKPFESDVVVQEFAAPLATLNTGGSALTVLASGFLDSTVNNNGASFGLFAALPVGGPLVALPKVATTTARLQVIHNSASPAAASVDVWLNNTKLISNFAFRTATPFIDAPAGTPFDITIKGANSTDTLNPVFKVTGVTLTSATGYIAIASGNVGTGFNPTVPFSIEVLENAQENGPGPGETDVLVYHGSTDAPAVDVAAVGAGVIIDTLSYSEFAGYLTLPTANYKLQVRPAGSGVVVQEYAAPLATLNLADSALVVLASGYLNSTVNNNGPAFGLFVALPSGGALIPLPATATTDARLEVIHNCASPGADSVDVWVNNTKLLSNFRFRTTSGFINAAAGTPLDITVKLPGSTDTSAIGRVFKLNGLVLESAEAYIAIASGTVGTGFNPSTPFSLALYAGAREVADDTTKTDVLVFHGSTDAPTVGVSETSIPAGVLINAISYGQFDPDGYLELNPLDYTLAITAGGNTVASFLAPLNTLNLEGSALTVLASGFLNPAVNNNGPAFGLWASTGTAGALVQLPVALGFSDRIANLEMSVFPNPASDVLYIKVENSEQNIKRLSLKDITGREVWSNELSGQSQVDQTINVEGLESGLYLLQIQSNDSVESRKILIKK